MACRRALGAAARERANWRCWRAVRRHRGATLGARANHTVGI